MITFPLKNVSNKISFYYQLMNLFCHISIQNHWEKQVRKLCFNDEDFIVCGYGFPSIKNNKHCGTQKNSLLFPVKSFS